MKKTISVFIASSLQLQNERNLIEKTCTERNNDFLEVSVCRFEKNGDHNLGGENKEEGTQDRIDKQIRECDVIIFFAGDRVGDMTAREFAIALEHAENKYIYFFQNPSLAVPTGPGGTSLPWAEFYETHMKENVEGKRIVRYEKTCFSLEELHDAVVKAREQFIDNPFRPIPCPNLRYDSIIPTFQREKRWGSELNYYIKRPEVDEELEQSMNENYRLILVCGPSTSGKTLAVCKMLQTLSDYSVVALNADTNEKQLNLLSPTQFATGKKILFLDDLQYIFWKEEGEKVVQKDSALNRQLHEIIRLKNPDLKIIATTTYDFKEMMGLLTFNHEKPSHVKDITIWPLSTKNLNAYARELRGYGYLKIRPEAATTIGSLFVDVDRIQTQYDQVRQMFDSKNKPFDPSGPQPRLAQLADQLCHAIKCLWMWKKRSRNQIPQLLDFLQFTYNRNSIPHNSQTLDQLFNIFRNFISPNYAQGTFEVEDIIVTHVFKFYNETADEKKPGPEKKEEILPLEKRALIQIVRYVHHTDKKHFFRNITKMLYRLKNCSNPRELQLYIIYNIVERLFPRKNGLYQCKEIEINPEGVEIDWVDIYIATIIHYAVSNEEAMQLWREARTCRSQDQNALRWLLPRLQSKKEKEEVYRQLFDENGKIKQAYRESTYPEFQTELINFLTTDQAKELYLHSSFLKKNTKTNAGPLSDDPLLDLLSDPDDLLLPNDSFLQDEVSLQCQVSASETEQYLAGLKEFRVRCFCQNLFIKSKTLADVFSIKAFLQENDKDVVPQEDSLFFFDFIIPYTWKKLLDSVQSPLELTSFFKLLADQPLEKENKNLQLNKTFILNHILDRLPADAAYSVWDLFGDSCDGYTLGALIRKAGKQNFEKAKGIFSTFMEQKSAGRKIKMGEIYLNRLLDTTSTVSGIKECETLFHKYRLLQPQQSVFDYPSEYTQGILYQRMRWEEIVEHMRKNRPQDTDSQRNIKTISHVVLKAPSYEKAHEILFGDCPDYLAPQEQTLLKQSPYVVSELFNKVSGTEEGEKARFFFEHRLDRSLLNHPDANILNLIVNNKYIYPFYEDKIEMIERMSQQCLVAQNEYTQKHLMFHFINSLKNEIPAEEKREKVNQTILQNIGQPKSLLEKILVQRYYVEGYRDYKTPQPYPVRQGKEWKIQLLTTMEYVDFLLENNYCDGNVVASFMEVLKNQEDIAELQKLQDKAMQKKVAISYKRYANLKNKGVVFSDPYLMVEDYPPIRDVCHQLRSQKLTYEQAEKYLCDIENKHGLVIARTQIYWNQVVSSMTYPTTASKSLEEILAFIRDHSIEISPEMYYSLLHTIESEKDYQLLQKTYKGKLTLDHLSILLKKCIDLYKKGVPEWAFMNLLLPDFGQWHELLKGSREASKHRFEIRAQSARYKKLKAVNDKSRFKQTFLFWWTIHYMSAAKKDQPLLLADLKARVPEKFHARYPGWIKTDFPTYPQEMADRIETCFNPPVL